MSSVSSSSMKITNSTKLRRLPLLERNKLTQILNRNDCWKDLAEVVTNPDNEDELFFNSEQINIMERQWKSGSSPADVLLRHWSTSGKEQPTLNDLLTFLKKAKLFRAVADVMKEVLKTSGANDDTEFEKLESTLLAMKVEDSETSKIDVIANNIQDIDMKKMAICYSELEHATRNFCDISLTKGGYKIGEGSYGSVYQAKINISGEMKIVAVKKLKNSVDNQFITELNVLTRFKHENLLPLLGFSIFGSSCCLIYEYMKNGSLQERLACLGGSPPLPWELRLSIAYGSALGINHLHTFENEPMVHRDIKSANILLDEKFVPKIGDFGLVRTGNSTASSTVVVTQNIYGTSVYMAREAFHGDVSVKLDTFSFGVVLLELLTGLPPYDASREDRDLITHMESCEDIISMLDPKIQCDTKKAEELHAIAKLCLSESKRARPTIFQILEDLGNCCTNFNSATK